jgi:hypothetical protein
MFFDEEDMGAVAPASDAGSEETSTEGAEETHQEEAPAADAPAEM